MRLSLRLKANLAFASAAVLLLLVALPATRHAAHEDALQLGRQQAALLTAEAGVAQDYTARRIAPLFSDVAHGQLVFVPASAPFYAVETEARMLSQAMPGVSLRRVVLDPVGADDTPTDWERAAIERLRAEPSPQPELVERRDAAGDHAVLVTPLLFAPGVCATCYPSRAAAPAGIVDAFGAAAGFNRKPGEVVGATVASVPLPRLSVSTAAASWLLVLAAALVGAFNLLLELLILRPLARVAAVAEQVSLGHAGVEEFAVAGDDEIGVLTRSFNRLRRSMESAIGLIDP